MSRTPTAILGDILHFHGDPIHGDTDSYQFQKNGLLLVEDGHVSQLGSADKLRPTLGSQTTIIDHRGKLIIPGFVDTHVHYPQSEIIASHGTQLLDWLNRYTYPEEARFSDLEYAARAASFFLDELLRNGTTTALVFGTVHPESVTAFFTEAAKRRLRMICGKVMMDRNAPPELCDTPETSYTDSRALIKQWHNKDRLGYAITPRFAPTSSDAQLEKAGDLRREFPDVHVHTHLSENTDEIKWVKDLFPQRKNYLDVYDHYGLLGRQSVFAHGIHLHSDEWQVLKQSQSNIAHCPTSNLFIGSGLFPLKQADQYGVRVGLGTDIGGGDSFSMLRTLNETYKIQQLQGVNLSPLRALYLATLGGAVALNLDNRIGSFEVGREADFIVLNHQATPLLKRRSATCRSLEELLFVLMMLGDDRAIEQVFVLGSAV